MIQSCSTPGGRLVASALVFLLASTVVRADTGIRLELVSSEGGMTTALVDPRDGTGRLFIVKRPGQIWILEGGNVLPIPFLDLSNKVSCCESGRGMASLAFHPDYETNGRFFVGYVNNNIETVVSRFTVSADPSRADPASERELLSWEKIGTHHHGGILAFGPDGYLYVANGEGDERLEAQDLGTFPGTILRLDVDRGSTYKIPPDNPFRNMPGVLPEVWARGVRNPWRISFDRKTGDLFIGDVGRTRYEEVNFAPASSEGGLNYGWPIKEAEECLKSEEKCADQTLVDPIIQYPHDPGDDECNAVIGGYFYRGPKAPTLYGTYMYGDFCTEQIWGARRNSAGEWITNELLDTDLNITTFGESESGVLYVGDFPGAVYRVVGQELFASGFESDDTRDWSRSQGDLEVVRPGLGRSARALEVPVDGSATKRFVRSYEPGGESTFRLGFDLNINEVSLGRRPLEILRVAGSKGSSHLRLTLEKDAGHYWLSLRVRSEDSSFRHVGRTVVPPKRTVRIEIDWLRASAAGSADGEARVFKNGELRIAATDLDNGDRSVRSVTVGLPAGSNGADSGSFLIDNYTSTP